MLLIAEIEDLSREIFGNIDSTSKIVFYIVALCSAIIFVRGIQQRCRLWSIGRDTGETINWTASLQRFFGRVLSQKTVRYGKRANKAGLFHALMFFGFVVLFIGTCLVAMEEYGNLFFGENQTNLFHKGTYYAIYEIVLDTFGLAFTFGCGWFLIRMVRKGGGDNVSYRSADWFLVASLLIISLSGFGIEGFRIIREEPSSPWVSFVGNSFACLFKRIGLNAATIDTSHFVLWWGHALLVFVVIAAVPYSRLMHVIAGVINLCLVREKPGKLKPVTIDELEETGKTGVEFITDFSRRQLMTLDACVACGRCTEVCPAFEAGKPLSPKDVVQEIRGHLNLVGPGYLRIAENQDLQPSESQSPKLHGDTISAETLWSCTTCYACHDVCPLDVSPVNIILDMRRFLIGEGELSGPPATALQKVQRSANPWGMPSIQRFEWSEGLDVPTVESNPDFEILYWVGCSASYDKRVQKVAQSVVKILKLANVNFATLGPGEKCTGDFARRMGDEFLFQELAQANIENLSRHRVRKIVTHCPHCLNSLSQDYPQFDGNFEVVHHSQFINTLVETGKLKIPSNIKSSGKLTYHDPCYLARVNGTTKEPRQLIQLATGASSISEMPRNQNHSSCCGAGGGRMWFDDTPDSRTGRSRVQEAIATSADTVAVACPFCLTMISDGVNALGDQARVMDIAELLAEALNDDRREFTED